MRFVIAALAAVFSAFGVANAGFIGSTSGPDSDFSINFSFSNPEAASVASISIDGSTAAAGSVFWDGVGTPGGSAVLSGAPAGEDTEVMSFAFSSFGTGDTFTLSSIDPDFTLGALGVSIADLIGVTVMVIFSDASTFLGQFVDDPAAGAGLMLAELDVSDVPVPAALLLFLTGFGGLAAARRRKAA